MANKPTITEKTAARAEKAGVLLTVEAVDGGFLVVARDAKTEQELSTGQQPSAVLRDALRERQALLAKDGEAEAEHGLDPDEADEAEGEPEDEDEDDGPKGNVVPETYRKRYGKEQNCGDPIALAVSDAVLVPGEPGKKGGIKMVVNVQALLDLGNDNGVDILERWGSRNTGMQRMNLANVLRGKIAKGEEVEIAGAIFRLADMPNSDRWNKARSALEAKAAKAKAAAEKKAA